MKQKKKNEAAIYLGKLAAKKNLKKGRGYFVELAKKRWPEKYPQVPIDVSERSV